MAFIRKYSRLFSLWGKRLGHTSCRDKLEAFCRMYGELSNNCTRICPIGMVAADYHRMPERIQVHSQELIRQVENWLENLIDEGISSGEFKPDLDRQETARHLIYAMSGALKMARIFKDPGRITRTEQALINDICLEIKEK